MGIDPRIPIRWTGAALFCLLAAVLPMPSRAAKAPAFAELSHFDVDKACADASSRIAVDKLRQRAIDNCIAVEQQSYDLLAFIWSDLVDVARTRCATLLQGRAYDWSRLATCANAAERIVKPPQPFRYH